LSKIDATRTPRSGPAKAGHLVAVHLSPKAFDVLRVLLEHRPGAVSKTDLHELVWRGAFVAEASLTMVITEIRKALGDDPQRPRFLRTVHRFGYAFCGEAVEGEERGGAKRETTTPKAWLVWKERILLLRDGENVIGRDPGCDIWLDEVGISRRHACIVVAHGAAMLEDLGSKNGTLLRNEIIRTTVPLTDGDQISFGPVDTQFRLWSDRSSTKTMRVRV
jgi:hypothetical protein